MCLQVTSLAQSKIAERNKTLTLRGDTKLYNADRQLREKIYGTRLCESINLDEPLEQEDVLRIIGLTNFLRRANPEIGNARAADGFIKLL